MKELTTIRRAFGPVKSFAAALRLRIAAGARVAQVAATRVIRARALCDGPTKGSAGGERTAGVDAFRVAMSPGPEETSNSYMRLLADALRERGVVCESFQLRKVLLRPPDVVHVHWPERIIEWQSHATPLRRALRFHVVLWMLRAHGTCIVWTVHNVAAHDAKYPRLTSAHIRAFSWAVDGFISLSPYGLEAAPKVFPRLRGRPRALVPHADYVGAYPDQVDKAAARALLGLPLDAAVALHLGRLRRYKNTAHLIRAFRGTHAVDLRLVVAGSPRTTDLRDEIVDVAGDDRRVLLHLDFIADTDLQHYLRAADLVVLPFASVLHSGSAVLALSFACPVLVPAAPGLAPLQETFGARWVRSYEGDLSSVVLEAELRRARARGDDCDSPPRIAWDDSADATLLLYRRARAGHSRR